MNINNILLSDGYSVGLNLMIKYVLFTDHSTIVGFKEHQ